MSKVRVAAFSVSIDGFAAGPDQSLEQPLGTGGMALHAWAFATRTFQRKVLDTEAGATGIDDDFAAASFENVGAWVMGRNMFGPVRGPWPDESWRGWWGDNPVYHCPVFVLTHHPRSPLVMEGGTTFHFVTAGVEVAIARAREAAAGRDVRVGGGASVIRQCLERRLIDEMHLAMAPVLLGRGEPLFAGLDLPALGYACTRQVATSGATHVLIGRSASH
jgi:dihydrofolate reductase